MFFFPNTTPYTKSLLLALSFSVSHILRPLGSLILCHLGDLWGRKATIIVTTLTMSFTSLVLACMPTYEQIGYFASIGVFICRALQGLSSAVHLVGARVYVTELLKAPTCYFYAAFIRIACDGGTILSMGSCALLLYLNPENGWRYVFLFGSGVALIGCLARTQLDESPEYLDAIRYVNLDDKKYVFRIFFRKWNNILSYFAVELRPVILYFTTFVYMGDYLAENFGYTPSQVIYHNLLITIGGTMAYLVCTYLTKYIYPLTIMKATSFLALMFFLLLPMLIGKTESITHLFIIQTIAWSFNINGIGIPIFIRGFPVIGRYTMVGLTYSLARAISAIIISYACVWLASKFDLMGVTLLLVLASAVHIVGLYNFIPCEEDRWIKSNWPNKNKAMNSHHLDLQKKLNQV